jgi:2-phosphosulfolactate phosphatase
MILDVVLNNNFNPKSKHIDLTNYVCGVIDVIRATTTMSVMIAKGCNEIIIAKSKTQAFLFKKIFPDYLLCGEEGGHPPEGFDFGNSPLEYSKMNLNKKGIILKTTNGTKSFFKTLKSRGSFVLSIVNINYTCDILLKEAMEKNCDIFLICSGEKGKIAYDDAFVAGMAIKIIKEKSKDIELTDSAVLLLNNYLMEKNSLDALKKSSSYRSMIKAGLGEDDVHICSKADLYNVTGYLTQYNQNQVSNLINNLKSNIKLPKKISNIFVIRPFKP